MHERLARCAARGMGQRARSARFQARPRPGQEGVQGEVVQPRVFVGSSRAAESQGERATSFYYFLRYTPCAANVRDSDRWRNTSTVYRPTEFLN